MCGLAGFWTDGVPGSDLAAIARRMASSLTHRGPDDSGIWTDPINGVALGHRRLSIVDLSPTGHQPMTSADGRFVLVFNGEIYNYRELRARLNVEWRGHSDTECLLEALAAWGIERALRASVGMFSLALWDKQERSLTLARDRLGEKPLYYAWNARGIIFGSELRALREHPLFDPAISHDACVSYLRCNFVRAPYSIYSGVRKLEPGSWLTVGTTNVIQGVGAPKRYWSLPSPPNSRRSHSDPTLEDAATEFHSLLRRSVRDQMVADVPLGAFLSGGVDSSLVVATMQSESSRPVQTFSVKMPDATLDESYNVRRVAEHLGTDHHEIAITPSDALSLVPQLGSIWDEPFADSSQIPTLLVSKFARNHVAVVLSGDGGDELFLGYPHYLTVQSLWRWKPILARLAGTLLPHSAPAFTPPRVADLLFRTQFLSERECFSSTLELCRRFRMLYADSTLPVHTDMKTRDLPPPAIAAGEDVAATCGAFDAVTYLPDDILVKVDRATMSVSLESRAPMLDHRIVEYAHELSTSVRLSEGTLKAVLRRAVQMVLPLDAVNQRKQGFSLPIARWLRHELKDWAWALLDERRNWPEVLDRGAVTKLWHEHTKGRDHSQRLWGILMLIEFQRRINRYH